MNQYQQDEIRRQLDKQLADHANDQQQMHRLAMARQQAVLHYKKHRSFNRPVIITAMAASLFLALIIPMVVKDVQEKAIVQELVSSDIELVSELELFEQDIEFYYWLEELNGHSG